ncbi:AMP-binding enzyme [Apiospora arundinis]
MAPNLEVKAQIDQLAVPPPAGTPTVSRFPGPRSKDSAKRFPGNRCLGTRPWNPTTKSWENRYAWQTYEEVAERAKNFGSGILDLHRKAGVTADKFGVGLWCQNRAEWQITDIALSGQSLYTVSLYETLGPDASEYIIKHAELACIVTSLPHIPTILAVAPRLPDLKIIVCVDPLDAGEPEGYNKLTLLNKIAAEHGVQIWSMDGVEEAGKKAALPYRAPRPEDVLTINYTSGTTGDPKGVVLTHKNCLAAVSSSRTSGNMTHKDSSMSYLPLAHIYGRMVDQSAFAAGAAVGFFHGDMIGLVEDLKILKPSGFISVPRLYNRIAAGIKAQTVEADGFKGALSRRVVDTKKANMRLPPGQAYNTHLLYDRVWTPKVRAAVGLDRVHSMGYGLTESYAVASFQQRGDFTTGNIGSPAACVEICLESIPDLDYHVTDKPLPRGELCLRGPCIFREYYKNEEETQKAIDAQGWFHTGDVAEIDEMGRIKIIDRKKNVLKLAQGEYVSPERLENSLMANSNLMTMAFVHGDSTQSSLVGVFGVDPVTFAPFASKVLKNTISPDDSAAIKVACQDQRVIKAFVKHLDGIAKKAKFNGYERVLNAVLEIEPFSIENGLFTHTLKLKRPQSAKKYRAEIDRINVLKYKYSSHIEKALVRLEPYNYGNDERKRLGGGLFDKIVKEDKNFERNFTSNGGRLSPDFEEHVRASAERLVQEDIERRTSAFPEEAVNDQSFGVSDEARAYENYDNDNDYDNDEINKAPVSRHKPKEPVTHQRARARIQAKNWQSGKEVDTLKKHVPEKRNNVWFGLRERPYLLSAEREGLLEHRGKLTCLPSLPEEPLVVHVDFTEREIEYLQKVARFLFGSLAASSRDTIEDLRHLCKKARRTKQMNMLYDAHGASYESILPERPPDILMSRSKNDLKNFVNDLHFRHLNMASSNILSVSRDDTDAYRDAQHTSIPSLLYSREIVGRRSFGPRSIRRFESFRAAFTANREDTLEPRVEWTNCAGDIMTLSWISPRDHFICGTTTHSDSHNQQYNKPGNLLLGSSKGTLRAFADHRIPRPVVSTGDNSLDSMVESQDPWLYTSVVSSDYDKHNDLAFTSSFDKTVKVWKVRDGSMKALDTWEHEGRVNFVLASKHRGTTDIPGAGGGARAVSMVATGADVATDAVRVYKLCVDPTTGGVRYMFNSYSCTKVHEEDYVPSDKWAYFPAAIRWGLAPEVQHLLLIGYSPRSLTDNEEDIPEEKHNRGELCLWDTLENRQISVNSAATQNVFEVAWHPSQNCFAAATSKGIGIERVEGDIKTQIRIFQMNGDGQYSSIKVLDCRAMDINELVIRQNSPSHSYVAAGCTDGNVYVWDTAGTDRPICVLNHGEPVEELFGDREREDVGVKFVEWASSTSRLYTGSSDGVVKVWDIRQGRAILVRDLIECAGPVTFGAFSPDKTQLAPQRASGAFSWMGSRKPFVGPGLSYRTQRFRRLDQQRHPRRRRKGGHEYVEQHVVRLHPDRTIGAVQGINYAACGFYRAEAHVDGDPSQPLLEDIERKQRESLSKKPQQMVTRLKGVTSDYSAFATTRENHWRNSLLDLDIESLEADKAELDVTEPDFDLAYEEEEEEEGVHVEELV